MLKRIPVSFFVLNSIFNRQFLVSRPAHYFSTEDSSGSSSKKYTSSFKLRSRLAEFFKHIHPDQMNQAPVTIPKLTLD